MIQDLNQKAMYIPSQIMENLSALNEVRQEAVNSLNKCLDRNKLKAYYQPHISNSLYNLFSNWLLYESSLGKKWFTSEKSLEVRQFVRQHPSLDPFKYVNFVQAGKVGRRDNLNQFLFESEVESTPGSPSAMCVLYKREPKARGQHTPANQVVIEMYDSAILNFLEVDATIQRMKRTADIICGFILHKFSSSDSETDFYILDIACGANYLAREIELRLKALEAPSCLYGKVYVLGVDMDSRASKFTFKNANEPNSIGWYPLNEKSYVNVSLIKGNLLLGSTQNKIRDWLDSHNIKAFHAVTALGIIDYFGCTIPGSSKEYISENYASLFGELMFNMTQNEGLIIGAAFSFEGLDPVSTGARHLLSNWQIKHAKKELLMERLKFLHSIDFYSLVTSASLKDELFRERLNRVTHFFYHDRRITR